MLRIFLLLALAGIAYVSLVRLFVRRFVLAWVWFLVASLINFTVGPDVVLLGGLHFSPLDLLVLCLLPAGIIRSKFYELKFSALNLIICAYLLLFALSVARGLVLFSLTTVGNEGRGLIGEVLAMLYFTTIPRDPWIVKKVVLAQIAFAAGLLLVCAGHYAGLPIGGSVGVNGNSATVEGIIDRALPASAVASMEIALFFAASWTIYRRHSRWLPVLVGTLTVAVIVLQHRTVWAMFVVTMLACPFFDPRLFRYLMRIAGTVAAITIVIGLSYATLRTRLSGEIRESATNSDTFLWRVQGWQRSLDQDQSILTVLIGLPMGSGYTRLDTDIGQYTEFQPHNEFINQYLRVGILGTMLLILFFIRPAIVYFRTPNSGAILYPTPASWIFATIGVIIFGMPYSSTPELMALVAMANSLIDVRTSVAHRAYLPERPLLLVRHLSHSE